MFKAVYEELRREVSGEVALGHVSDLTRFHRIQASPGMRTAVEYAADKLGGYGLRTEVRRYKADGKSLAWGSPMFKEWNCEGAELRVVSPVKEARRLALYAETKMSIIQRSYPTPKGGVDAEVVVLDKGEEEKDYLRVDVTGKVVLTNGDVGRVRELAVERYGAVGVLYDGMWVNEPVLKEGDLDDALKYTSFWWYGGEAGCWGFVLTPRMGRWLRKLVKESKETFMVHAEVRSSLYEGEIENCVATVQGETKESVVVAHICHPQPSANDNASGCGAAIEAARAIQKLITEGKLRKPKRSIVFTLVPEMTGTYPYLAENETRIPGIVAAVNLDMVGENQNLCGGPLIVERTPESCPSYVNSLMEAVYDEVKAEAKNLGGSASYPLFKAAVTPFSGGSDHIIYSDPTVGIGCPMLIQWPDKFYHTSWDTIDKVDSEMLRKVALMTATYAYAVANAEAPQALWVAGETASREKEAIIRKIRGEVDKGVTAGVEEAGQTLLGLRDRVDYWAGRASEAVESTSKLAPRDSSLKSLITTLKADIAAAAKAERRLAEAEMREQAMVRGLKLRLKRRRLTKVEREASTVVPLRKYRGPVSTRHWARLLKPEERDGLHTFESKHRKDSTLVTLADYWADGDRSVLDISWLVWLEAGRTDTAYLLEHFRWLGKMGLVKFR